MNQMSYSPGHAQRVTTDHRGSSQHLSQSILIHRSFEATKKLWPAHQDLDTSLPQNRHLLVSKPLRNEFEQTFVELKNCLNMKEFQKFQQKKKVIHWQKYAQQKNLQS